MLVLNPAITDFSESCFPFLSYFLIGEEYQKKIKLLCSSLSTKWNTSQIGFECNLSDQQNWGDFHCLVDVQQIDEHIEFDDPSWTFMANLLSEWSKNGFLERNHIGRVILEFDVGSSSTWPPKPNLCLLFTELTNPLRTITDILSYFKKASTSDHYLATIDKILAKGGNIRGFGLMLARFHQLRILTHNCDVKMLPTYLYQPEVREVADFLLKTVAPFPNKFSFFEVDIHEDGMISPKLGINVLTGSTDSSLESMLEMLRLSHVLSEERKKCPFIPGSECIASPIAILTTHIR